MNKNHKLLIGIIITIPIIIGIIFTTGFIQDESIDNSDSPESDNVTDPSETSSSDDNTGDENYTNDDTNTTSDTVSDNNEENSDNQNDNTNNQTEERSTKQTDTKQVISTEHSQNVCRSDNYRYTTSIEVTNIGNDKISGRITFDFNENIRTTELKETQPIATEVTQNHGDGYKGNYEYMQDDPSYKQDKSSYTYSFEIDTRYKPSNRIMDEKILFSPQFKLIIVGDNYYDEVDDNTAINCISSVEVQNRDAEQSYISEHMISVEFEDTDREMYNINTEGSSVNVSIIGDISDDDALYAGNLASRMIEEIESHTSDVEIHGFQSQKLRNTGIAYNQLNQNSKIYIENKQLDKKDNIVLGHELVHSYQDYKQMDSEIAWWEEGSAQYIGAIAEYNAGLNDEKAISSIIIDIDYPRGTSLSDPTTWTARLEYYRGAKIAYIIDRKIREQNQDADIVDLMNEYNQYQELTKERFLKHIEEYTDREFKSRIDEYMTDDEKISLGEMYDDVNAEVYEMEIPTLFDDQEYKVYKCNNSLIKNTDSCWQSIGSSG